MDELRILQAIASYGESQVLRNLLHVEGFEAVVNLLRASVAAEMVKRCNWVRTLDGSFVKL